MANSVRPPTHREPWRWAEENVIIPSSAVGEKWTSGDAVFVREIMEAFADEGVNEIAAMCSAQSAKTLTILCCLLWAICEDPGPILWVTSDKQEAVKLMKGRLIPMLERCGPVWERVPKERGKRNLLEIYFPGAPLIITGAKSPASLQSTPFRYILLDEVRSYPPGALEMVEKRTRAFPHNYKKIIISTPDLENDALHAAFLKGDQRHFLAELPCGHAQELDWKDKNDRGGLKWDSLRNENGRDLDAIKATVRYQCQECGEFFRPTLTNRKHISSNGHWERRNPNAPSNCRSFTWGALLPWWTDWGAQVVEYLSALQRLDWGDHEPLKSFVNETKGQPWTDLLRYLKHDKFLRAREADYDPKSEWPLEVERFATIDVQAAGGRHYYLVIRAWGMGGISRLLHAEKIGPGVEAYANLLITCETWKVPKHNIAFDVGTFQSELFNQIMEAGSMPNGDYAMKAMWGDDRPYFLVDGHRHLWTVAPTDPYLGRRGQGFVRPINVIRWSKPSVQDRLAFFMHGLGETDWRIPPWVDNDYRKQVTAWDRREFTDARGVRRTEWFCPSGRPDHYYSCELEQVVCASARGLLSTPREDGPLFEHAAQLAERADV